MSNLKDRIENYISIYDYKLMEKLPIIICINGRGFSKTTQLLEKPYDNKLSECLMSVALKLCYDIDGALFAYHHNDEIIIVARNDQHHDTNSWYLNKIQKICSVTSSLSTLYFNKYANANNLNLTGDSIFASQTFVVPSISETINTIIYKQQQNFHASIQLACFYELLKFNDKNTIKEMLTGLSIDEKIDLLKQECGIDFNSYPAVFRRGAALYKTPKVTDGVIKNKWFANLELPIFTKDQSFVSNLLRMGSDIYRGEY